MDPLLVEGEAREGTEGRLKRTLSDIFLARGRRNTRDGGQLGHSLISAVTTSFLGWLGLGLGLGLPRLGLGVGLG